MPYGTKRSRSQSRGRSLTKRNRTATKSRSVSRTPSRISALISRSSRSSSVRRPAKRVTIVSKPEIAEVKSYKVKPISNKLKGVSKSFATKVDKVINSNECWGEFIYYSRKQMKQNTVDEWSYYGIEDYGYQFFLDTSFSIMHAASQLYLDQPHSINPEQINAVGGTNAFDRATPIKVLQSYLNFQFKSTSLHVMTVECFECTAKANIENDASALDWAKVSFDDYQYDCYVGSYLQNFDPLRNIGTTAKHLTSLHARWDVKVHTLKLLPGESSAITIMGRKKTYDFSQAMSGAGNQCRFPKGSKSMFFRVISEASVSSTPIIADPTFHYVQQFPNGDDGGIALTVKRSYRIAPPKSVSNTILGTATADRTRFRNVVRIQQNFFKDVPLGDQQVPYNNPTQEGNPD